MDAPQEIVVEIQWARLLEGSYAATLWVDAGHDVFDRPVLPGGIHSLQDDQKRALMFGVQQIVQRGELLDMTGYRLLCMAFRNPMGIVRRISAKLEFNGAVNLQPADVHPVLY
jgi:hypothetical protein